MNSVNLFDDERNNCDDCKNEKRLQFSQSLFKLSKSQKSKMKEVYILIKFTAVNIFLTTT
uniref:Uncharacterized protein n=1 Tax=Romanomermis culicivorax TaxID=13658 RepID=A0A915K3N4_ROMCU